MGQPSQAGVQAADGFFLEMDVVVIKPPFGQVGEGDFAGTPNLVETGYLVPEFTQTATGECGIGGLERPADLLARAFE